MAAATRYELLRAELEAAILRGELPPGTRLEEEEIAQRHGVSRTPVREVLRLLAATGLVELRARQGAVVAELTIPALIEMFQVMAELEGLCARNAARRIGRPALARLAALHDSCMERVGDNDPEGFYAADRHFHEALYAASANRFLEDTTRALRNRVSPYRRYVTYQPGRMLDSVREHEAVLGAVHAGDGEAAHRLMRDHVSLLGDRFADFVSAFPRPAQASAEKRTA
jgi:DNA-binding GntR family transcriptional regulator